MTVHGFQFTVFVAWTGHRVDPSPDARQGSYPRWQLHWSLRTHPQGY